jgi:hypothetical protein
MGAIGYTTGDPNKVNVTGDTMTGDLILAGAGTDLTVGGVITDTYQGVTGDVTQLISTTISTGITSGGILSINGDPTKIDIVATTGQIVDYNPNAPASVTSPKLTHVTFGPQTGIVVTNLAQPVTFWLLNSVGALIQQAGFPTQAQFRTHVCLGATLQSGGVVTEIRQLASMSSQPGVQTLGLMVALGAFNAGSNTITANGVNLQINTDGGNLFAPGHGYPNYLDPNISGLNAQAPISFRRATATAIIPGAQTLIDVANYDPLGLGVVTPVPNPPSTCTIHRVWGASDPVVGNQTFVQYGQRTYASLDAGEAAIGAGAHIPNPVLLATGSLLGYIVAQKSATDLSNVTQARFVKATRFPIP